MARWTFPVQKDGLIVDVFVWLDPVEANERDARGLVRPAPIRCRGLIDTGADLTAISSAIVAGLGLVPSGTAPTMTAAGPANVQLYVVSLSITEFGVPGAPLLSQSSVEATEFPVPLVVDILIGMNVLLNGLFYLDGPSRSFTLDL